MNRFKNHLIAAAMLSVLAIVGTIMNSHQVAAQGPPDGLAVRIVNPIPVPVTGSLGVNGTVPVTGSVSITGNSAAQPLFVRDVAQSVSASVELACSVLIATPTMPCRMVNPQGIQATGFTVPSGHF